MTETNPMEFATKTAERVYVRFLSEVLEAHVINDREGALAEKNRKKVEDGSYADIRVLRLMSISGKGGYSADPEKQKRYEQFFNVTLLDHLLSVTRGSLVMAALHWTQQNPNMDASLMAKRLSVLAVIAFMHDADKDLQLARNTPITTEDIEERIRRYGIAGFLNGVKVSLSADQLRYLIEKVESTQAHRHSPDTLPPREFEPLPLYVRLADQLDGAWLSLDPEKGGFNGVLKILKDDLSLGTDILKHWKEIHLFDPHHPFLLDELQRWISRFSLNLTGIPPLIEVHQDGHLFMLVPESRYDEVVKNSIDKLCATLPFNLELNVSSRGIPALYNGQPTHDELEKFVQGLTEKDFSDLFKIKRELKDSLKDPLDVLLSDVGLQPRWADKPSGALTSLFVTSKDIKENDKKWLYRAAHLALLLNLKIDAKPKDNVPSYQEREAELIQVVPQHVPDWIQNIKDGASRQRIIALWVTACAEKDDQIIEKVWGDNGLLKQWLEGDETRPGFNRFITGQGVEVINGVRRRFQQLLTGQRVTVENEKAEGRCLFTDEPVDLDDAIDQALGLYGVKVSAFSGRDGRPELITSEKAHTNVGTSSIAEHKTRSEVYELQGGKDSGVPTVPTLVSSPTTSGLFGGFGLREDRAMGAMSLYDLSRMEIKKGRVLKGIEMYQGRFRMARLERIPEKLSDQVSILEKMLRAARRIGRPIHVFKGLPTLRKEYFYYDAMPEVLANLIGGNTLYLEQIPNALGKLQTAQGILETDGLGYDILKLYATPNTRFGAVCLILSHLRKLRELNREKAFHGGLTTVLTKEFLEYWEETKKMNEQDGALVRLGKAAAGIQQKPGGFDVSTSKELLVFNICMDTADAVRCIGQNDKASLVNAIAGELETNLVRKDMAAAREYRGNKTLIDGCKDVAELFVTDVWFGILKGKSATQKSRRVMSSIYRISFLTAQGEKKKVNKTEEK